MTDPIDSFALEKKRLRQRMRAVRDALTPDYLRRASDSIQDQVLGLPLYREAKTVFAYVSMPGEPATGRIIRRALADGKRVYVPKCQGRLMLAVRIDRPDALRPGAYGIPEPADCEETAAADALDLILVPCVAASADGRRLGHGAGYYDRFLGRPRSQAVGLCFRRLLCPAIPMAEHDIVLAQVISDQPDA